MFIYLLFADILKSQRNKAAAYALSDHLSISRGEKGKAKYVGTIEFSL